MQASFGEGPFLLPLLGIKDRAFQAEYKRTTLKKSVNDEAIHRITTRGAIYRAADGSNRREQYGKDEAGSKPSTIIIYNPARQVSYLLDAESKTFFTMPLATSNSPSEFPPSEAQDIGRKVIEDLVCRGYRLKRQENGEVEYWISEELQEVVLAKIVTRDEESTLQLFNIRRIEPAGSLFTVPKDYEKAMVE